MRFHLSIIAGLLVAVITLANVPESRQIAPDSPASGAIQPGPCVVTAVDLATRHPGSRILFVRYFNESLGHAYTLWKDGVVVRLGDVRGSVVMPALAWDSAYVCATHAVPPNESMIFLTAAFVR